MKPRKTTLNLITSLTLSVVMFLAMPLSTAAAVRGNNSPGPLPSIIMVDPAAAGVSVPITGTADRGGKFVGTFTVQQFAVVDNKIVAVGTLTGTISNAIGNVIGTVLKTVQLLVTIKKSTCEILLLELGPIDLDLLGLQVHLDRVVLEITADPTGGLLGSLLCAVANLLNSGGLLSDIANLLNQILALL